MHQGDPEGAIVDYSKAIELQPARFSAASITGPLLESKRGSRNGAIVDFNAALEINPLDVDAGFERGVLRGAKSDLDGALAAGQIDRVESEECTGACESG